ncbi:hypothetical protein BG006_002952, partial [Podila minutissima]
MSDKFHRTKSPSNTQLLPEYNVLVLGETQSGKSTLVQYMRKYANPNVEINTKALGTGFLSHTQEVTHTDIFTDLPEYFVQEKKGVDRVNYGDFLQLPDQYDYEDALNMRKGLETKKGAAQLPKKVKFNLIDTPGLNATQGDDESHVQKIFLALNKVKTIHLLLITISSGPFTYGLREAIKAYVGLIPCFGGTVALVHTHFDYKNFHPTCAQESRTLGLKTECLRKILGWTTLCHFKIDCNINNKRPIRECITQNKIRRILGLAVLSQPINVLYHVIQKTRKMRDIDNILRGTFEETSILFEQTLQFKNTDEGELLAEGFCNAETRIDKPDPRMEALKDWKDIEQRRNEQVKIEMKLQVATDFTDNHALKNETKKRQTKAIRERLQIQDIVRKDYLWPEEFDKLILAEAYKGDPAVS